MPFHYIILKSFLSYKIIFLFFLFFYKIYFFIYKVDFEKGRKAYSEAIKLALSTYVSRILKKASTYDKGVKRADRLFTSFFLMDKLY